MPAPPEPDYVPPGPDSLHIVYIDEALIVADKPRGLLSVPGRGSLKHPSVRTYLSNAYGSVFDIHRLDLDTSGLIVMARTKAAQSELARQFASRDVIKVYDALVSGTMDGSSGEIDLPIGRDWDDRPRRCIDMRSGKPSKTLWKLETQSATHAHVRLQPLTGRTHQLRLHMASIGHPILGDRLYGEESSAGRLCLHASSLMFRHAESDEILQFQSTAAF